MATIASWAALALGTGFAVLRAWQADERIGAFTQCHGCFFLPTLARDAVLLAGLSLLLAMGSNGSRRWLQRLARWLAAVIIIAMATDMAIWTLLSQRFYLTDLLSSIGAMGNSWTVVTSGWASVAGPWRWVIGLAVLVAVVGLLRVPPRQVRSGWGFAGIGLAWAGFAAVNHQPLAYVHQDLIRNVVEINRVQGRQRDYSQEFSEQAAARASSLPKTCEQRKGRHPNIIVLLTESLSAWHSKLLGGPADWTPQLDAIARSSHYLSRFYANGFTTSGGEISAIAGVPPLYRPRAIYGAYDIAVDRATTLPGLARRHGYGVQYFTNGDNDFLDVGEWLQSLGFDHVEGKEATFYKDLKRYEFDAPADEALFDRYLKWMDEERPQFAPSLSLLMTVTGHPPFQNPASGRFDEEATVRYVDAQIGRFHRELEARGFFDDGILLILGDHRSMTPLRVEELQMHGQRAFARIPLIVAGNVDMPAVVDSAFQQADLLPSLGELFGDKVCRNPFQGSLLRVDPQPAKYVLHARGDDRNRVDVYFEPDRLASYRLDGDDGRWTSDAPADARQIEDWIATLRTDVARPLLQGSGN